MNWPESPGGGFLGDDRHAHATDRPESIDALRQTVRHRVAEGHAIYPQGGCSALEYGGQPHAPGVAIDTRALSRVVDYPAADMTITVEAGLTMSALKDVLSAQNQRLLIDAPKPETATIGGVYATNTCGPRRFGAGRPRDQILGVSFVTADGSLVSGGGRVVKNVAGYDFPRLLTGSLGTLGILAQMTLKVRPRPEASALIWATIEKAENLAACLALLNTSDTRPIALELLNPAAARLIGQEVGKTADGWAIIVGFEDNATSVAWQLGRIRAELGVSNTNIFEGTDSEPLWSALNEFQAEEPNGGAVGIVANVRPSSLASFCSRLDSNRWAIQAHAGNGIVRAHLLVDPVTEAVAVEVDALRAVAVGDGGNLTVPRCPTDWKPRLKVWGEPRPDWAIAEKIKDAFDPARVMNPGRFVGTI